MTKTCCRKFVFLGIGGGLIGGFSSLVGAGIGSMLLLIFGVIFIAEGISNDEHNDN